MNEKAIEAADDRARFEAWAASQGFCLDGGTNEWTGQFEYEHEHIDSMWFGWKAAIAAYREACGEARDAARYRYVRAKPAMLLHLSNKDFDAAIDTAMRDEAARGGE